MTEPIYPVPVTTQAGDEHFEEVRKEAAREVIAAKREARYQSRREIKEGAVTITEFLSARIAEDERAARQATTVTASEWVANGSLLMYITDSAARMAEAMASVEHYRMDDAWRHAERQDPARTLAECEAKRAIVEAHQGLIVLGLREPLLDDVLRHLAAVYADHPDYDPAWRVDG